ncbi:MAG: hypothetical protein KC549_02745 [Myxococcales bacterium]|nr:hypothetical protein [Myxococcales bacterium]MCB9547604.1 hypothetical protein [Myxococcales bacterium]
MPFNPNQWGTTSGKVFHPRSPGLLQVDAALTAYLNGKSSMRLRALARAILAWQATKPSWMTSIRGAAMVELVNYVKAEAKVQVPAADQEIFSYVHCEPVVTSLNSDPRQAMMRTPLYIAGAPDGPTDFHVQYGCGDPTFLYDYLVAGLGVHAAATKYTISPQVRGPTWRAVSIAMHTDVAPHSTADDITGKLHRLAGASHMTTGQLSGCAFVIRENAGHVECTHIKPNGFGGDGVPLQDHLESLYLGPGAVIWGRKDYPYVGGAEVRAAIIGRRGPHGWEIFAQRYQHQTSNVLGVHRIWPRV